MMEQTKLAIIESENGLRVTVSICRNYSNVNPNDTYIHNYIQVEIGEDEVYKMEYNGLANVEKFLVALNLFRETRCFDVATIRSYIETFHSSTDDFGWKYYLIDF